MRYQGGQEEVGVDGVSLSEGGADKVVPRIGKVIFVESSLGESTIVIRDGEWLTGGGNPPVSQPGILSASCSLMSAWLALLHSLSSSSSSCCSPMQVCLNWSSLRASLTSVSGCSPCRH